MIASVPISTIKIFIKNTRVNNSRWILPPYTRNLYDKNEIAWPKQKCPLILTFLMSEHLYKNVHKQINKNRLKH